MQSQKILLLLVNYFNEEETKSFIEEQVQKQTDNRYDIVIALNGCNNPRMLAQLEQQNNNIFICNCGSNIGYLPGAAFGLRYYLLKGTGYPGHVIISNCDIEIPDPDFFKRLNEIPESEKYDVLGPDIHSSLFKQRQNPYIPMRISLTKMKMLRFLTSNACLYNLFLLYYHAKTWISALVNVDQKSHSIQREVYGIHGSFMIFRNSFFEKGGNFDYPVTLFGEEIYIAETARKNGIMILFDPGFLIIHREHNTTGIFKSKQNVRFLHQSYTFFIDQVKNEEKTHAASTR
jgi:GT2 family glycosyltransferase